VVENRIVARSFVAKLDFWRQNPQRDGANNQAGHSVITDALSLRDGLKWSG
jgi:hypothetical protein